MVLERTKDEILIRLSTDIDVSELQNVLDYLKYKESSAKSKAKPSDAQILAKGANESIWSTIKKKRNIP